MEHHEPAISVYFNQYIANPIAHMLGIDTHGHSVVPAPLVMVIIVAALLLVFAVWLRRRLSVENPGFAQQGMEVLIEAIQGLMNDVIGPHSRRFFPLLGSLFVFILTCNLLGQFPGFLAPTADISIPLALAAISFLYYNYHGIRVQGPIKYVAHFAGPVLLLAPLIFLIEIVSHAARVVSLSVRLFCNIFAEELITSSLAGIFPFVVPLPTVALGLFASLIQALIFVMLTMVYIGGAVSEEH